MLILRRALRANGHVPVSMKTDPRGPYSDPRVIMDGNHATAHMAYALTEQVC